VDFSRSLQAGLVGARIGPIVDGTRGTLSGEEKTRDALRVLRTQSVVYCQDQVRRIESTCQTRSKGIDRHLARAVEACQGLTPEECERLFTPYYTTKHHGTGLGLAIVQSVVSDHHGKIAVASDPGRGSTFTIELPLEQGDII
jgi:nitrogen-specific signal transduction histidine kinase